MIVVDASALIELLLQTETGKQAETRLFQPGETVHAPALADVEVAQVLRRFVARNQLSPDRAQAAIDILPRFPMQRYAHEPFLGRIWQLRDNLTAYDAAYVALAEGLRAPLLTCDTRLANAPALRTTVELLA
jgi:predicted nucleic acid-binding protein